MTSVRATILALALILALGLGAVGLYANGRNETYRLELAERCRGHVDSLNGLAARLPGLNFGHDRDVYIAEHHCLQQVTVNGAPFWGPVGEMVVVGPARCWCWAQRALWAGRATRRTPDARGIRGAGVVPGVWIIRGG